VRDDSGVERLRAALRRYSRVIVENRFIYCDSARLHGTCTNRPLYINVDYCRAPFVRTESQIDPHHRQTQA